jgi:DNA-binding MarR family transcriptional regulator/GNAT superfamily N-acetyltransferase
MVDAEVEVVRSFNRTVTERIGALHDRYLGRDRPLGEARLLWELDGDGRDLASLRTTLQLDSAYLSRLLRALEADNLIRVVPSSVDRRARIVLLTTKGHRERDALNRRSDELGASLLAPLTHTQRDRLTTAMSEVERLLTAAAVTIAPTDSEHPDAQFCLQQYATELKLRSHRPFDPKSGATALPHEVRPPNGEFFVAYLRSQPIGCGAVKHHDDRPAELKRMWIAPDHRGLGLGKRLLRTLESCAQAAGARFGRLETSSDLGEAVSLYRSASWVEIEPFNDEPFADLWFEKELESSYPGG